jgi:hypothetical protein
MNELFNGLIENKCMKKLNISNNQMEDGIK